MVNKKLNVLLALFIIFVLVGVGVYYGRYYHAAPTSPAQVSTKGEVSKIDITSSGTSPKGFPVDLPINKGSIVEQNQIDYPAQGVTLYSISYRTALAPKDVLSGYKTYFSNYGYTLTTASSTKATPMTISGKRYKDSISVVVTPDTGFNLVTLGILSTK